jgi:hypothetical protein
LGKSAVIDFRFDSPNGRKDLLRGRLNGKILFASLVFSDSDKPIRISFLFMLVNFEVHVLTGVQIKARHGPGATTENRRLCASA